MNLKNELIKTLSHKISTTEILHFEEKETVKTMSNEQYMNIFWLLLGGSPFFGWWWVVVDIFWLVVGGGEYILAGGEWWGIYFGWWWVVVDGGGRWHSLA